MSDIKLVSDFDNCEYRLHDMAVNETVLLLNNEIVEDDVVDIDESKRTKATNVLLKELEIGEVSAMEKWIDISDVEVMLLD